MHKDVCYVMQVKLSPAGANVAFLIPVCSKYTVDTGEKHVCADVELSLVVQKRTLNVLLNDVCFLNSVRVLLFCVQDSLYALKVITYLYPIPSVGNFSWLDDPHIL